MNRIKYVGMDVHKKTIVIALADEKGNEARLFGSIENSLLALDRFCRRQISEGIELRFVYEAGPCGYGIYRHLISRGHSCTVVAPSLIPRKAGERIKTDPRDALKLVRLYRAGELTAVHVPDPRDEAMRDLTRAREDAQSALRKARQRLGSFLLRNNLIYSGKSKWSKAHWNWLYALKMPEPPQQIVLGEYMEAIEECVRRVERHTEQIRQSISGWRFEPVVQALQSMRGVSLIVATTTLAELGDLRRFDNPGKLMAFLGLIPSEHSSGGTVKKGGITKSGNVHVRTVLMEAAHAYRLPARVSRVLQKRQEGTDDSIRQISWKAQVRLCARYRKMLAQKKPIPVIMAAIARELSAFIWAIAQQSALTA